MNKRRVFAWIAIALLGCMYLACLVLALIGSEAAQFWLKVAIVCTMVVPLVLYGFLVLTKANQRSGQPVVKPEKESEEPSGEDLIAKEAVWTAPEPEGILRESFERTAEEVEAPDEIADLAAENGAEDPEGDVDEA